MQQTPGDYYWLAVKMGYCQHMSQSLEGEGMTDRATMAFKGQITQISSQFHAGVPHGSTEVTICLRGNCMVMRRQHHDAAIGRFLERAEMK
jgi:hypothetical protein